MLQCGPLDDPWNPNKEKYFWEDLFDSLKFYFQIWQKSNLWQSVIAYSTPGIRFDPRNLRTILRVNA